ncbi:MAG: purine permease [Candidatus Cloacimonetes bacterium]|nr:purine permease [Candidatus Cloacimonadota bacterium]MCF7814881.1 purine permease [Candidatus Cloacimonadota bacterium]MCF7868156.1 purine permease [Candidatus Cloacimonadota bacterium]MCF7884570.1 purine permease [Candidatus Cloacimonadota bacterium]
MEETNKSHDLIYTLNEKPPVRDSIFAALQHLLAIFVGIITPTLVIGGILGLGKEIPYLISMSLIVSGVATFIQIKRIGPIGSGLLSIQGTSFAFLGAIIGAGFLVKNAGGGPKEMLGVIFGMCFFGAFIEMILSRFLHHLKKVITPTVTGIVVSLIGLSLIKVGLTDMAGGQWLLDNKPEQFGNLENLGLAFLVLITIVFFNRSRNQFLRMSSIVIGLIIGYIVSLFLGRIDLSGLIDLPIISIPIPFKYGIGFRWEAFVPIALVYLITTIESIGDLTATSMVSKEPIRGDLYIKRIKGGVLGDGFNSAMAAIFNTFPNTTFSQNNGVIQLTGVASRYVGMYIAGFLVLLGLFPVIGGVFQQMPKPVLGGATIIMFGTVAAAGIKIISSQKIDRRAMMIIAISFSMGLGVQLVPQVLNHFPETLKNIFSSPITTGGLTAIVTNLVIPDRSK